ncbi:MAG: hypothetical protein ACM31L_11940 [Actinomycetota bacterium]
MRTSPLIALAAAMLMSGSWAAAAQDKMAPPMADKAMADKAAMDKKMDKPMEKPAAGKAMDETKMDKAADKMSKPMDTKK